MSVYIALFLAGHTLIYAISSDISKVNAVHRPYEIIQQHLRLSNASISRSSSLHIHEKLT